MAAKLTVGGGAEGRAGRLPRRDARVRGGDDRAQMPDPVLSARRARLALDSQPGRRDVSAPRFESLASVAFGLLFVAMGAIDVFDREYDTGLGFALLGAGWLARSAPGRAVRVTAAVLL